MECLGSLQAKEPYSLEFLATQQLAFCLLFETNFTNHGCECFSIQGCRRVRLALSPQGGGGPLLVGGGVGILRGPTVPSYEMASATLLSSTDSKTSLMSAYFPRRATSTNEAIPPFHDIFDGKPWATQPQNYLERMGKVVGCHCHYTKKEKKEEGRKGRMFTSSKTRKPYKHIFP